MPPAALRAWRCCGSWAVAGNEGCLLGGLAGCCASCAGPARPTSCQSSQPPPAERTSGAVVLRSIDCSAQATGKLLSVANASLRTAVLSVGSPISHQLQQQEPLRCARHEQGQPTPALAARRNMHARAGCTPSRHHLHLPHPSSAPSPTHHHSPHSRTGVPRRSTRDQQPTCRWRLRGARHTRALAPLSKQEYNNSTGAASALTRDVAHSRCWCTHPHSHLCKQAAASVIIHHIHSCCYKTELGTRTASKLLLLLPVRCMRALQHWHCCRPSAAALLLALLPCRRVPVFQQSRRR